MQKTKFVKFRVSKDQYERICSNARLKGFKTVSGYIRELSLKNTLYLEQKISSIDKKLELLESIADSMKQKGIISQINKSYEIKIPSWFKELKDLGLTD